MSVYWQRNTITALAHFLADSYERELRQRARIVELEAVADAAKRYYGYGQPSTERAIAKHDLHIALGKLELLESEER